MTNEYGEIFETTLDAKKLDSKGRRIGFTVKFRDNGENFRAWVQNSRMVDGEWTKFGASQYHKNFDTQAQAKEWAYSAAKERIAKLHTGKK